MPEKQSRDPLLYIHQPDFVYPKANMQQTYIVNMTKHKSEKSTIAQIPELETEEVSTTKHTAELQESEAEKAIEEQQRVRIAEQKSKKTVDADKKQQKQELDRKEVQDVINQYHHQKQDKDSPSSKTKGKQHSYSFKRVKSFKEMNTVEKLNYLEHFPKLLPPVPCIFVTGSSSVRGFLMNKTEDSVEIKQFNEKILQIPIEQITDVKMLGLQ
ncbi:CotO family spore coat protein [Bacillus tuaregi]|uniref:CotO family spore coat protein n=1 Tax=Bacillus tuaregi TaxID=1816695 RepID=UPI0008F83E6D|nr:CotO family spore coat protein [Bacillus tuaregi]